MNKQKQLKRRLHPNDLVQEIDRESLERIARIIGTSSGAAKILQEAASHDGPCRFYTIGNRYILEKLPKEALSDNSDVKDSC